MKLLSIRVDGDCHAGALIGEEVLDFCLLKGLSAYKETFSYSPTLLRDAIDLLGLGAEWVRAQIDKVSKDTQLAETCRSSGALAPRSPAESCGRDTLFLPVKKRAHTICPAAVV